MSDELDDEYDDFEDSFLEDDDDLEDSEEFEDDEEDLYDEYDDEDDEYDDEDDEDDGSMDWDGGSSSCYVCHQDSENVREEDRWKFAVVDEDGSGRMEFWACRSCREKFSSLEEFDEFRRNWTRARLYRCAARLQRLIVLKAPDQIIAREAFLLAGILFSEDSGALAVHGLQELGSLLSRVKK